MSVLLLSTGSSTLVLTSAVTVFCELSAASDTRTRIVLTTDAALLIVPSSQVTFWPEITQPAGASIGVIWEGIVATSCESAAAVGPLLVVVNSTSASPPASISAGPLTFTARSAAGVTVTVA